MIRKIRKNLAARAHRVCGYASGKAVLPKPFSKRFRIKKRRTVLTASCVFCIAPLKNIRYLKSAVIISIGRRRFLHVFHLLLLCQFIKIRRTCFYIVLNESGRNPKNHLRKKDAHDLPVAPRCASSPVRKMLREHLPRCSYRSAKTD